MNEAVFVQLHNFKAIDLAPKVADFDADVISGLSSNQKTLSPKYFYDEVGSALFESICLLDEYYVTRAELSILRKLRTKAQPRGTHLLVVELGGASSFKFRNLLQALPLIKAYMPIDISRDALFKSAEELARDFPNIDVTAICADYLQISDISEFTKTAGLTPLIFFPGSTIGNLAEAEARQIMSLCYQLVQGCGYLLLGCDLQKPESILIPAYADKSGVTAAFNKNILTRINNELNGNFDLTKFKHIAIYNYIDKKVEMHLVSTTKQVVSVGNKQFSFEPGETIHTEDSRKFTREIVETHANQSGFVIDQWWIDDNNYFALALLRAGHPAWGFSVEA